MFRVNNCNVVIAFYIIIIVAPNEVGNYRVVGPVCVCVCLFICLFVCLSVSLYACLFFCFVLCPKERSNKIVIRGGCRASVSQATSFHPWESCFPLISSVHPAVSKMGTGREDSERIVGCLSCSAY